jgi:hypothetical protein
VLDRLRLPDAAHLKERRAPQFSEPFRLLVPRRIGPHEV